jgi:hypothetical protein
MKDMGKGRRKRSSPTPAAALGYRACVNEDPPGTRGYRSNRDQSARSQASEVRSSPRRMPPPTHDKSPRFEPLPSDTNLAQNIAVFELAVGELDHGRIADRADFEPSNIGAVEGCRRRDRARSDHIDQTHSEAEEFLYRHQLVESRTVDVHRVHIAADDIRQNPALSIASAVREPNEPLPYPMSKIAPRSRASKTSSRICPSSVTGAFGNGRKQ